MLFYCSGIPYAECQIQYDAEADRVLRLGGNTLRGNFATAEECDAWLKINDTNRDTKAYSQGVKAISLQMQAAVKEINCLKQCMAESTVGCIQKCSR